MGAWAFECLVCKPSDARKSARAQWAESEGLILGAVEVVHVVAEEHQQQRPEYHLDGVGRPVKIPDACGGSKAHGEVEPKGGCHPPTGERCGNGPGASPLAVGVLRVVAEDDLVPAVRPHPADQVAQKMVGRHVMRLHSGVVAGASQVFAPPQLDVAILVELDNGEGQGGKAGLGAAQEARCRQKGRSDDLLPPRPTGRRHPPHPSQAQPQPRT